MAVRCSIFPLSGDLGKQPSFGRWRDVGIRGQPLRTRALAEEKGGARAVKALDGDSSAGYVSGDRFILLQKGMAIE